MFDIAAASAKNPNYREDFNSRLAALERSYANIDIEKTEAEEQVEMEYSSRLKSEREMRKPDYNNDDRHLMYE